MKQIVCMAVAAGLLFTACKKSSSSSPSPSPSPSPSTTIPSDGWKLGANQYKQVYCLRQTSQMLLNCVDATTGSIHSFAAFFKAYPTASGTYHIVKFVADSSITYPGANIGDNDIIVTGSIPTGPGASDTYWSIGTESKDATVTITGGKIKIEVPQVSVVHNSDTLKLAGTMIEN